MNTETASTFGRLKACFRFATFITVLACHPSAAFTLTDFAGRWAATTNDRNIIVIDIVYDQETQAISGTFMRPTSVQISPPLVFSAVRGPVHQAAVEEAIFDQDRLRFSAVLPSDSKQRSAYEMVLQSVEQAQLRLVGVPIEALTLIRVDSSATVESNWDEGKGYLIDDHSVSNAEMARLFNEDQADRANLTTIDWSAVGKADAARRDGTRRLLSEGSLHTGTDFRRAAFVFQHGDKSDDFLLAHTLAMIAVAKGRYDALWIGTASLDRYLQSIGQPQIYNMPVKLNGAGSKPGLFDAKLISDSLRQQLGVPTLTQQEEQREFRESQRR